MNLQVQLVLTSASSSQDMQWRIDIPTVPRSFEPINLKCPPDSGSADLNIVPQQHGPAFPDNIKGLQAVRIRKHVDVLQF